MDIESFPWGPWPLVLFLDRSPKSGLPSPWSWA